MGFFSVVKWYWKVILCVLLIGYLSLSPADDFNRIHIAIPHFDKVIHFLMFFGLGLLLQAKYETQQNISLVTIFPALAIVYGGIIEIVQWRYIDQRSGDWVDWLADIFGIIIAIFIFKYLPYFIKKILS